MADEFQVTSSLKGAIGETLLTEHKSAIREYFSDWCVSDLESHNPEWIPNVEYHVRFDIERVPHSYDIWIDGDFATWYPDALYSLTFQSSSRSKHRFDRYTVEYPVEVKTGQSAELSDNQRAVMASIEQQSNPTFPLRIRVDVGDLPDSFSITPYRIQHTGDGPLPEYTTDNSTRPPTETTKTHERQAQQKEDTWSDSTVQRSLGGIPDSVEEENVPQEITDAMKSASDQGSSQFTVDGVLQETQNKTKEEIQEALSDLKYRGLAYQPSKETWKFI